MTRVQAIDDFALPGGVRHGDTARDLQTVRVVGYGGKRYRGRCTRRRSRRASVRRRSTRSASGGRPGSRRGRAVQRLVAQDSQYFRAGSEMCANARRRRISARARSPPPPVRRSDEPPVSSTSRITRVDAGPMPGVRSRVPSGRTSRSAAARATAPRPRRVCSRTFSVGMSVRTRDRAGARRRPHSCRSPKAVERSVKNQAVSVEVGSRPPVYSAKRVAFESQYSRKRDNPSRKSR